MTARAPAKPAKPRRKTTTKAKPAKPARRKLAAKGQASARAPARKPAAKPKPARRKRAPKPGPVVAAVKRDLARMPPEIAESAEAATALTMATRLDSGDGSPSECAKALLVVMGKLREMCPPDTEKGELHAIRSGRADRLTDGRPAG
jgi:hypothetical protein